MEIKIGVSKEIEGGSVKFSSYVIPVEGEIGSGNFEKVFGSLESPDIEDARIRLGLSGSDIFHILSSEDDSLEVMIHGLKQNLHRVISVVGIDSIQIHSIDFEPDYSVLEILPFSDAEKRLIESVVKEVLSQ